MWLLLFAQSARGGLVFGAGNDRIGVASLPADRAGAGLGARGGSPDVPLCADGSTAGPFDGGVNSITAADGDGDGSALFGAGATGFIGFAAAICAGCRPRRASSPGQRS